MLNVLGYVMFIGGLIIFGFGYLRTRRNLMLIGTVLMVIAPGLSDMAAGFKEALR